MRAGWMIVAVFAGFGLLAAGCGGSDYGGYEEEPYRSSDKSYDSGQTSPAPADTGERGKATGDETGGGSYGKRVTKGTGQEGQYGEEEYKELADVGKQVHEASKLYKEYMNKKMSDGTKDEAILGRAISMYEQLLPRVDALLEKRPDDHAVAEMYKTVSEELRALKYE